MQTASEIQLQEATQQALYFDGSRRLIQCTASRQGQTSPTKKLRSKSGSPLGSKPSTPSPEQQSERSVWVAVRARPLVSREHLEGAKVSRWLAACAS